MTESIKITLIGGRGSGKTCYLLGMYIMMNYGKALDGFHLSTDHEIDTRFAELWHNLITLDGVHRWPPKNSNPIIEYDFDLNCAYEKIISFDWIDYRGGALYDNYNSSELVEIEERIIESNCIFICISSENFNLNGNVEFSNYRDIAVTKINNLISKSRDEGDRNIPPAVVIIITKSDLWEGIIEERLIINNIKNVFQNLFSKNSDWLVLVCPVSLGREILEDDPKDRNNINTKNLHVPILFSLYAEMLREICEYERKRKKIQNSIPLNNNRNQIFDTLFKKWLSTNNISPQSEEFTKVSEKIKILDKSIKLIGKKLLRENKAYLFHRGKRLKLKKFFSNLSDT